MIRSFLVLLVVFIFAFGTSSWATCPEDTLDRGECDTMYVEPWPDDVVVQGDPPYFLRVPIYVTNDVADVWDSIYGFCIPLCYTHTNPSKYCSLSAYWNDTNLYPWTTDHSIFRHLETSSGDTVLNRMMLLSEQGPGMGWEYLILNLDDQTSHFWLSMIPTNQQLWWEGSRILLVTMTFKTEDTMSICIDTCFWPPESRLAWIILQPEDSLPVTKVPRPDNSVHPDSFRWCFSAPRFNQPPEPFTLLSPADGAFLCDSISGTGDSVAYFDWVDAYDPNMGDQITYDLYTSTSDTFPPGDETIIYSDLVTSHFVDTLPVDCYYWKVKAKDNWGGETWSLETWNFIVRCGDVNCDCRRDLGDVVYLINYIFRSGPPPDPLEAGDCDEDGTLDIADVVSLISYLYRNGPTPCCP